MLAHLHGMACWPVCMTPATVRGTVAAVADVADTKPKLANPPTSEAVEDGSQLEYADP